jgi:hypothetical protein
MNRVRAFAQSWSAMLLAGCSAALSGLLLSVLLFEDRQLCEPVLIYLLPVMTKALFRSAFYYEPEQYYWIASYVGGLSLLWTLAIFFITLRAPAENKRVEAALLKRMSRQEASGAPIEP